MKALILVWVVAAWSIWPVLSRPTTAWAWGGDDGIIAWELNQTIGKLPGNLKNFFSGNIFYPYKNTMALNMLLVPSALLAYLPTKLTDNPVTAYNTTLIAAQFLTVTILYLWWKELSGNRWAAALATIVFALSQTRMLFDVHIHMWIMQWLVFCGWMLWRYTRNKRVWQLYAAGFFFGVQCWESIYQAFWVVILAVILLWQVRKELGKQWKHLAVIASGVGLVITPVLQAYFSVYSQFKYAGSIREAAHFAMSLNDLWGEFMSPGLYVLLTVALLRIFNSKFNVFNGRVNAKAYPVDKEAGWLMLLLVLGVVMALGPVLKWDGATVKIFSGIFIPLPYGVMYYLVPGVSILRSVHRYILLSALAASGLVAWGLGRINLGLTKTAFWAMLLVAVVGGGKLTFRGDFPKPADYPKVYSWLAGQPGQVILEYPVYTWADQSKHGLEMYRMIYSLKHKKQLVNGAAGFMPPERGELLGEIVRDYPNAKLDQELDLLGVNYVVVHKDETDSAKLAEFAADKQLVEVWEDKDTAVFSL